MTIQDVFDFLYQYRDLFMLALSVLLAVINIVTRGRYKSIISEVNKLFQYRSADYRTNPDTVPKGTTFSNLVPQYRLNKASGELEEADPIDITALVNSARNVELKQLLSRLEAGNVELSTTLRQQYEDYRDDLDILSEANETRLSLCEKFKLDPTSSYDVVMQRLEAETSKLAQQQDLLIKNKEIINHAQENFAQAKQPPVQEHSEESA